MRQSSQQQTLEQSVFGNAFNLHPLDSLTFLQKTHQHLRQFTYGFKERIEAEIQYSKALIKVSKILAKHVNAARPSPISYISSAFKVQHELRARHALQLAEYLHTEIQIPCESLLQQTECKLKQISQDLKRQYKQGQNVEQTYQKHLKKYYRSRQDWEERMITKTILPYIPGVSASQIQKANTKLLQEKEQNDQLFSKYLASLQGFNKFAQKFNNNISQIILVIEKEAKKELAVESNCLRKLIVSEINMFKNIEYDMINISKQMETIQPKDQLQVFLQENGPVFSNPIISIYSDGPILENNWESIDFKYPITRSLLEETLLKIQRQNFTWTLQNKHNSTLKYALNQAWAKFQGKQAEDFMEDLQDCIVNNKVIKQISINNEKQHFLNSDQAFSVSFSIITNLASFIRPLQLSQNKQTEIIQLLRSYLTLHHFYRFFATTSLEEFLNLRQNVLDQKIEVERLVMIVKLLIEQCVATKDIFVMRSILSIMFSTQLGPNRVPLYSKASLIDFDIWSNNDFWESILFEATFEQITLLPTVSKTELKQIYLMRQKNIVFSILATYCHYMVMIGCELQQVKDIAGRFCHIYGLYEEHERDLLKMIKASDGKLSKLTNRLNFLNKESEIPLENVQFNHKQVFQKPQQFQILRENGETQKHSKQISFNSKTTDIEQQRQQQLLKQEKSTNQNLLQQKPMDIDNGQKK